MTDLDAAADRAVELADENDYSLRVAVTYASREFGVVLEQHDVWELAQE